MMASKSSNNHIMYIKTPQLQTLSSLICFVNREENQDKAFISDFHLQILKCRMMIYTIPQLLVCPSALNPKEIIIMFQRKGFDLNRFQAILRKFNIKVLRSEEASASLLEASFRYSLTARLAPRWNLLGDRLYVAGRDFLSARSPLDAVTLTTHVSVEVITLDVKCHRARLGDLHLQDLDLGVLQRSQFERTPRAVLDEASLLDQWVHVLPSLKKGRIINIHKEMPKSLIFNSYKELKRHWKNIYGFRLPESDEGLLYCEVHFRPQPIIYTYPILCLRPFSPILSLPPNHKVIAENLFRDLRQLPALLGQDGDSVFSSCPSLPNFLSAASQPSALQSLSEKKKEI